MEIYLILSGFIFACLVALLYEYKIRLLKKQRNNVHFYVARDAKGDLWLYLGKPFRGYDEFYANIDKRVLALNYNTECYGLNPKNYDYLKWEDEPVEVFLNLED